MKAKLHFLGAAGGVTGFCVLIETSRAKVLVDCGLFQGPKTLKQLNYNSFPFSPAAIDAVLLTHAHIDHSGLIPKLAVQGYAGPIHATAGTIALCGVMLPDAGAIQEMEVETLNRRNAQRARETVEPIYTKADAEACLSQFSAVTLDTWLAVVPGIRARWWNAGHILGSASIEVEVADGGATETLLFSGDLGPGGREFADDPEGPQGVDHLILESTYGNVEREAVTQDQRRTALAEVLQNAHDAGGPLLIPAFAVERTQELIVDLLELMEAGDAPRGPIFLDSPLAIRASKVFLREGRTQDGTERFRRLRESNLLRFTESANESRTIERIQGWHIIIAASGMCDAGRVRHHLKRLLPRKEATVLIAGFQAVGTLGRLLQDGRRWVRIQGDDIRVKAAIRSIDVYSGHADALGLVAWAKARGPVTGSIFLLHGEPDNLLGLKRRLEAEGLANGRVVIPRLDEVFSIEHCHAGADEAPAAPRIAPEAVSRLDWHNARAALLADLNESLDRAPDDRTRERMIAEIKRKIAAF
ncbi:MAG: MBL fold metallo-hydrolase [Alsobacter sp.]